MVPQPTAAPQPLGGPWPGQLWSNHPPSTLLGGTGTPGGLGVWSGAPCGLGTVYRIGGKPSSSWLQDQVWEVTGPTAGSWGRFLLMFTQHLLAPHPPFPRRPARTLTTHSGQLPTATNLPSPGPCPVRDRPPRLCCPAPTVAPSHPHPSGEPEAQGPARTRPSPEPAEGRQGRWGWSRPGASGQEAGVPAPKPGSSLAACSHRGCARPPVSPVTGRLPHCTRLLWGPRRPPWPRRLTAARGAVHPRPFPHSLPRLCGFNWR